MTTSSPSPETQEERTARHLRMLRELAECGMKLALGAFKEAAELQAAPEPAEPAAKPHSRGTHPVVLFEKLSRNVQQIIALEARIAAGPGPAHAQKASQTADPRRAPIRQALQEVTEHLPDRKTLRREAEQRLDAELLDDPDQTTTIVELMSRICNELGIEIDVATLSDEVLDLLAPEGPTRTLTDEELLAYARR